MIEAIQVAVAPAPNCVCDLVGVEVGDEEVRPAREEIVEKTSIENGPRRHCEHHALGAKATRQHRIEGGESRDNLPPMPDRGAIPEGRGGGRSAKRAQSYASPPPGPRKRMRGTGL